MKWQSALFLSGTFASQVIAGTDSIDCDIDEPYAGYSIINGIEYLRGLDGQPVARAEKCNRVSCSYGGGIYVCSDDGKDHPLKSWGTVADVAEKIKQECGYRGRLYSSDGWGAIIQGADC
ncbi:hypothetical protein ASPVEDRAFT_28736 [Aspergillus versicolor CBS 583.65]|uniref:Ecp2 effector protein domain-containing protein n=1 Tax=Aspergillus versicolor CBS 583.65 TaxID=1036611 RepID=A0A1L9PKX4_ASPVE|nr:uncharacterized protein ASPVEDRAFT_28736 [Aspergillus versicolor CBS 583.65]OJJ02122.1 hypothetical protein ASPVEDRAFT_28736 [Aspergillus versicolor CBS 583.65]